MMNEKGIIAHAGFWTYVLIVVIAVIVLYFIAPPIYQGIVNALTGIADAVK